MTKLIWVCLLVSGCATGSAAPVTAEVIGNVQTNYKLISAAADSCVQTGLCKAQASQIAAFEAKWSPVVGNLSTVTPPTTLTSLVTDLQFIRAIPGVGGTVPNPSKTQEDLNTVLSVVLALGQIAAVTAPLF